MAFTVEAYYEQENNQAVTDRIEIQEDGGAGRNLELGANGDGFKWRLSEITSESTDGLINPLANKIQVGKLTFFPRIETTAEQTLLDDILGSPDTTFRIVWKQKPSGGSFSTFWTGNIDNKKRSYPETGGSYFATLRANDFEILKSIDYTLDDTRQTLITTIADLLGNLSFGLKIRTATSWITQDTTDTTDFLSQIYHETKALRNFGRTGDESDQPISVWDALLNIGAPALLFRQVNGEFTVEQLTEFDDPENVNETVYTSAGVVDTATTTVDRTLDGFKATSEGDLVVKDGSPNDQYPAIKRAKVKFDHRTQVSGIQFEENVELDSTTTTKTYSQFFLSDGNQQIEIEGIIEGYFASGHDDVTADIRVKIVRSGLDDYFWDGDDWVTTGSTITVDLNDVGRSSGLGQLHIGGFRELTDATPADADGTLEITLLRADSAAAGFADTTIYRNAIFDILNEVASENSTSIDYQLTQSAGYSTTFELDDTLFGDGPIGYSTAALRFSSSDGDFTVDSWQRRGTTTGYRNFHEQLLKEILDLQRTNTRKLNADFWGTYDPSKILVYDSQNFYCAGVSYVAVKGRWNANLFRINVQTGSDTFEDIPKFTEGEGSGTGSAGGGSSGGGLDQSTADARYFQESNNLSEGTPATMRANLGLTDQTADLDLSSVKLGNLTENRVLLAGASGLVEDNGNLVFDGNLGLGTASPNIVATGRFLTIEGQAGDNRAGIEFNNPSPGTTSVLGDIRTYSGSTTVSTIDFVADGATDASKIRFFTKPTGGAMQNRVSIGSSGLLTAEAGVTVEGSSLLVGITGGDRFEISRRTSNEMLLSAKSASFYFESKFDGFHFEDSTGTETVKIPDGGGLTINTGTLTGVDASLSSTLDVAGLSSLDGGIDVDGAFTVADTSGNVVTSGTLDVTGITTIGNDLVKDNFALTTDFSGTGWEGDSAGDFNIRNLVVRESARFRELIIDELSIIAGSDLRSIARGKIQSVDTGTNTVVLENPNEKAASEWVANDFFWAKAVDVDGSIFLDLKGQITNVDVTSNVITLTLDTTVAGGTHDGGTTDISDLSAGNVLVQRGHPTNTDRQALIYTTVSDSDAPVQKYFTGIDSLAAFDAVANISTQIGVLDGLTSTYSNVTGEGFFSANFFATDAVLIGDLDKADNYLEYASGSLTANLSELDITIDANNKIVADATGISLFAEDFDFAASGDFWRTSDNTGSLGSGVLTWDGVAGTVGLAGFTASSSQIKKTVDTGSVIMGDTNLGGFWGFGITGTGGFSSSDDFVRMFMASGSSWGMQAFEGGSSIFRAGSTNHIASWNFEDGRLYGGEVMGEFTGMQSGAGTTKAFFAGADDKTGTNATAYITANGQIFYDALSRLVYAGQSVAAFTENASADSLTNDVWSTKAESISIGDDTAEDIKIRTPYYKRFGENNMTISGWADFDSTSTETATHDSRIYLKVYNSAGSLVTETFETVGSTGNLFTLTLDISGLSDNTHYEVRVTCWAFVDGDDANSGSASQSTTTELREDILVFTTT